jgi:hypothetical protein
MIGISRVAQRAALHPDVQAMLDAGKAFPAWWPVLEASALSGVPLCTTGEVLELRRDAK